MPQGDMTVHDRGTQSCRTQELPEHPTLALARMCLLMIMTTGRSRQLPDEQRSARDRAAQDGCTCSAPRLLQPQLVVCWSCTSPA